VDRKYFSAILLLITLTIIVVTLGTGIFYYQKFLEEKRALTPPAPAPVSPFPEVP